MNALSILFTTDRFNLSRVAEYFINPCCFGEDLAEWLRQKLTEQGVKTSQPYQEDWGWELPVRSGGSSYYLCLSGNLDDLSERPDEGEWRIIVEKKRSMAERIRGKGKITAGDDMLRLVVDIVKSERGFRNVHLEET